MFVCEKMDMTNSLNDKYLNSSQATMDDKIQVDPNNYTETIVVDTKCADDDKPEDNNDDNDDNPNYTQELPVKVLQCKATELNISLNSKEFAIKMDQDDPLADYRNRFHIPLKSALPGVDHSLLCKDSNEECIYLCGHSLGLMPKTVAQNVAIVLEDWKNLGVHMHFAGRPPVVESDLPGKKLLAKLCGAKPEEVAIMNGLTVNLHLLLSCFYRPSESRKKIVIEANAFPSDMYTVKSHLSYHGFDVNENLIQLQENANGQFINCDDIIRVINENKDTIALILLPGIQYLTGEKADLETIVAEAHKHEIIVGVDAAHALGNVQLQMHNWNVDFAAFCTYKYLNSGPGCIAAIFVHEMHFTRKRVLASLNGWWGNDRTTKFQMRPDFEPEVGADQFKLSNPSPMLIAIMQSSLDIYTSAGMKRITQKQHLLTGYLEYLLNRHLAEKGIIRIVTPSDPRNRGSQLSIVFNSIDLSLMKKELERRGCVFDIRMPNIMRIAPMPLYNTFAEVYTFVEYLCSSIEIILTASEVSPSISKSLSS